YKYKYKHPFKCLECDSIKPYSKEEITLRFRMAMVREECLEGEENGVDPAMCEWESDYTENDQELLLVSMNETSVAVMSGRGCDPENPCNSCGCHGCNLSEVVVVADSCNVTSGKTHCMTRMHIVCLSAPINVYYYTELKQTFIGKPVVLELNEINEFLKCTCESQKVVLKSECCDEEKLKKVCKDDKEMLSFVFYMKTLKDDTKLFESAAHRGWFIETNNHVAMENRPEQISGSFYFQQKKG
uniref:Interleukin-1 beta n=1 Tax=Pygocentrus nattereri TaxID=42514 RepID=A0A3B4CBI8_PYGNA